MAKENIDKIIPDLLRRGNLPKAEILLRAWLRESPEHPEALFSLGQIAAAVNLPAEAANLFERAARRAPQWPPPRVSLERLRPLLAGRASPDAETERFLLIKAWGYGFWADVAHVLGQCLLAELTGRIPVVHWGTNSLFGDGGGSDAFRHYFEPLSRGRLADLERAARDFWPPKWNHENLRAEDVNKWSGPYSGMAGLYLLGRPETVVVSDFFTPVIDLVPWIPPSHPRFGLGIDDLWRALVARYLCPRPEIIAETDAFVRERIGDAPFVAAHVRGSDKALEVSDLAQTNRQYGSVIDAYLGRHSDSRLFLMTDDAHVLEQFHGVYGDRLVATDCQRTSSERGIHYQEVPDRRRLGIEVMVDAYVAARAAAFIGNGASNPSLIVRYLKDWPDGAVHLFGGNMYHASNLYLHDW